MKSTILFISLLTMIGYGHVYQNNTKPPVPPIPPVDTIVKVNTCIQYEVIYEDYGIKIYGDTSYKISKMHLLRLWRSKPRKTPEKLMLAKCEGESGFTPYLYRLEKSLKGHDFDKTSLGLFQVLGEYSKVCSESEFTIDKQIDLYDDMMDWCLKVSNNNIPLAIFRYHTPFGAYYNAEFVYKTLRIYNSL